MLEEESLSSEQRDLVRELCRTDREIERSQILARSFQRIVRQKQAEEFEDWVTQAEQSELAEWKGFAESLRNDQAAVVAALKYRWSNG